MTTQIAFFLEAYDYITRWPVSSEEKTIIYIYIYKQVDIYIERYMYIYIDIYMNLKKKLGLINIRLVLLTI